MTDALVILGRSSPSWSELYVVYELVQSNDGSRMKQEEWISHSDEKLFTRTVNSHISLRTEARHGKDTATPPLAPMEKSKAINLMKSLVRLWFKSKLC